MTTPIAESVTGELLASIGAKTPVPGGGAVASIVAALGAALGEMVVAYSAGRRALSDHDALHEEAATALTDLRTRALALAEADARAYQHLNTLWRLDAADPARAGFQEAVRGAIAAPSGVLDASIATMELLVRLAGLDGQRKTNPHLDSDLAIAAILADAAGQAAAWNVRINLSQLESTDERAEHERKLDQALQSLRESNSAVDSQLRGRS